MASSIQYVACIAGVCKRLVRRLSSINRQAFTRDRFGKYKRIEGKKHNFCTLNACEIFIHLVVNFLSQVIFVFLLFLGMVMYAIWSWNKRKTKITSDKKLRGYNIYILWIFERVFIRFLYEHTMPWRQVADFFASSASYFKQIKFSAKWNTFNKFKATLRRKSMKFPFCQ